MVREEKRYNVSDWDVELKYETKHDGWSYGGTRVLSQVIVRKKVKLPLNGKVVIFTGELTRSDRIGAQTLAKQMGAIVKDTVPATGTVDFVIVGTNPGSKLKTAIGRGAEVVNDREWNSLVDNWKHA